MKKLPYNTTDKYTKAGFLENGVSKEEGYNCLSMMLDFCKEELDLDYKFDEKILGDITWENVVKVFHDNPGEVFKQLEKHFLNYYEKVPPHTMRKGDTLSVDTGDGVKVPCIFAGNNKVLITTKKGVKVLPLFKMRVYDVYRVKEAKKIITKAVFELDKNDKLKQTGEESYLHDGDVAECYGLEWPAIVAIISAVLSLASAVYAYLNMPDKLKKQSLGRLLNTRTTKEQLRVVYGVQRVGGNDVYITTMGDYHKYLYIIQTLSEGECDSINQSGAVDQIQIDGNPYTNYTGYISYQFYSGSDAQTVDAVVTAADANYTDTMRHTCYIRWRFLWDKDIFPTGKPTRTLDLKGRKVYDFRDTTTAWSDNVVLCLYDYLTSNRYGLDVSSSYIDTTSWTTAANYIDTKSWSFNYPTSPTKNSWSTIQDMLIHFRGSISWFDGKYYLLIADINDESSVMTITDEHIVQDGSGKAQIRITQPSRFNKPTGLKVTFLDKEKDYTQDEILIGEETGVVQNLTLAGITDRETAANIATYSLERAKLNRIIAGTFRDDCLELAPHDLVTFTSTALAISAQAMRVTATSFAGNGLINLALQYESTDLYDDDYDTDIEGTYTCILPDPHAKTGITNLAISEETFYYRLRTESRLHITFTVPDTQPWFDYCEVWQAITASGAAAPVEADYEHQFNTTNDFNIDHVEQDQTYYLSLVPVSIYGVKETFNGASKISSTVVGNSSAPASLAFLSAIPSAGGLTLFSDKLTDPDIEVYEFRLGTQWQGAIFLSAKRSPQESLPGVKPGSHTFFANTKGANGIYGTTPRSATATINDPIGWTLANTFTLHADVYDAYVALPNDITGITKANPGVVSSIAHGLAIGDNAYFLGLTEMTELNTTTQAVTAVGSADLFSINDTSGYVAAETTGGATGWQVGIHDNTESFNYGGDEALKCSHTADVLTGTYTSPSYDTAGVADDYYMYLEAAVVVTGVGTAWEDVIPTANIWSSIGITTNTWNEIFTVDEAPKVNITIYYRALTTDSWSSVPNAEILSALVNARYFKVGIEIEDPSLEINAVAEKYSLYVYTET